MYKQTCNDREPTEMNELTRIINRHKARILQNLEDAGCPVIFRDAVTSGLNWLRSDIQNERKEGDTNDTENIGNC